MGTRKFFSLGFHRDHNAVVNGPLWDISLSGIAPDIHGIGQKIGHQAIIPFRRTEQAKRGIIQSIRRSRRAVLFPVTINNTWHQPGTSRDGLLVTIRDSETLRRLNAEKSRCVCWILWNTTDPEAIDSAIRVAGTFRWLDGDVDINPPFDVIVSAFEACFDSNQRLYPRICLQVSRPRCFLTSHHLDRR